MSNELLPCPFCGAMPDISDTDMLIGDEDGYWARLWCERCGASGPAAETNDRPAEECVEDAVAAWNKRTIDEGMARP